MHATAAVASNHNIYRHSCSNFHFFDNTHVIKQGEIVSPNLWGMRKLSVKKKRA